MHSPLIRHIFSYIFVADTPCRSATSVARIGTFMEKWPP